MFRIRKILDNTSVANRAAIDQVLHIISGQRVCGTARR
jgi:hypothetical protein